MDTNMDNRRVRILQLGILALNVVSVMGLSIFIYATIENIRRSYVAREFLSGIQAIVWYPPSGSSGRQYVCAGPAVSGQQQGDSFQPCG